MRFIKGFFIFMTCALLLMVTLGGLAFYVLTETADKPQTNGKKTAAVQAEAEAVPALSGPLNILLMGSSLSHISPVSIRQTGVLGKMHTTR